MKLVGYEGTSLNNDLAPRAFEFLMCFDFLGFVEESSGDEVAEESVRVKRKPKEDADYMEVGVSIQA